MFYSHEFLTRLELDLEQMRLLRHDNRGLVAWRRGGFQKFVGLSWPYPDDDFTAHTVSLSR